MKKFKLLAIISIIFAVVLSFGLLTACEDNADYTEGLKFTVNEDGVSYSVAGMGEATDTDIVIPSVYNGKPVTEIAQMAFYANPDITSVVIPDSVTEIGGNAFNLCINLTSVVIPDSIMDVGMGAFYGCDSLAFAQKDGLRYLGNSNNPYLCLIEANTAITTAVIESSCKIIGTCAFSDCENLVEVEIPDGIVSVGSGAFFFCKDLSSIKIGGGVAKIGDIAFECCFSLTSITVSDINANYKSIDGNLYSKDGKTLIQYAIGKTETLFSVPSDVTTIGRSAFSYCDSLASVEIGGNVTTIGDNAFSCCGELKSVLIGESVTMIESGAFAECTDLVNVVFKNTNGWCIYILDTDTSGTSISPDELANTSAAAELLKTANRAWDWKRG